jgi:hypothetical protein
VSKATNTHHVPNLSFDARRGTWVWRMTHPVTGKRRWRDTKQVRLDFATKVKLEFEDQLRQELAGIRSYDHWRLEIRPLADEWIASHAPIKTLEDKKRFLFKAIEGLHLKRLSDLADLGKLQKSLKRLERTGVPARQLRKRYQGVLRQFSKWLCGNGRYLERDPLATWVPYPLDKAKSKTIKRFAIMPDEFARALTALDLIDCENRRKPQRPFFLTLLVTAARVEALASRTIGDFQRKKPRIDLGEPVGNKLKGQAALDHKTAVDLSKSIGDRAEGPLFLSPAGARNDLFRPLDIWREALGLGLLDALWPADVEPDLELARLVNRALLTGKARVSKGGNPKLLKSETLARRAALTRRVEELAKRFRTDWETRLGDVHSFRKTHRTWAESSGVIPAVIDKQLGHGGAEVDRALEVHKLVVGSRTGRKHYLDLGSDLFDARRSAEAVRELLDVAETALREHGSPLLFQKADTQLRSG